MGERKFFVRRGVCCWNVLLFRLCLGCIRCSDAFRSSPAGCPTFCRQKVVSRQSHPIARRFQLALLGDFDMGVVTQIKDLDNTPKNVAKGAKSGLIGGVADKVGLYRCSVALPFFGFVRTAQIKSPILSATAPKHSHTYVCSKFLNSECEQGNRCNSEFAPWFALQNQSGFSACERLCL